MLPLPLPPAIIETQAPEALSVLLDRARKARDAGRLAEAIQAYDAMLAQVPDHETALLERAETLGWAGRYGEAREGYLTFRKDFPGPGVHGRPGPGPAGRLAGSYGRGPGDPRSLGEAGAAPGPPGRGHVPELERAAARKPGPCAALAARPPRGRRGDPAGGQGALLGGSECRGAGGLRAPPEPGARPPGGLGGPGPALLVGRQCP